VLKTRANHLIVCLYQPQLMLNYQAQTLGGGHTQTVQCAVSADSEDGLADATEDDGKS